MKIKYITFTLFFVCVVFVSQAQTITEYTYWSSGQVITQALDVGTQNEIKVKGVTSYSPADTAKLVVYGDLSDNNSLAIIVSTGSTLIVYGDLTLSSPSSKLFGNVIVTGATTLGNADILGDANLISLGNVTMGGGSNGTGDIYTIPPATGGEDQQKSIEDLVIEMSGDESLAELIESISIVIEKIIDQNTASGQNVIWDGTDGTNVWTTTGNWFGNISPSGDYSNITIQNAQNPYCNMDFKLGNLELDAGAAVEFVSNLIVTGDLIINEGSMLTVGGDLFVLGDILVSNTPSSPASIIVNGSVIGDVIYDWTGLSTFVWWHIGLPINGVTETNFDNSFGIDRYALNRYTTGGWSRIAGMSASGTGNLDDYGALEGYNLYTAEIGML